LTTERTQEAKGALVLGCGRSGTSAVTRCLVLAGFFAGRPDELLGASPANPTGHFEPLPVLELNERLLGELGSAWWAEAPIEKATAPQCERGRQEVSEVVRRLFQGADGAPVVIKEPRINGLLDLWGPVADGLLHPILVVRNPIEVAFSLSTRDGNSIAHSLAAWEVQTSGALRWSEGKLVTVVHYAQLTRAPSAATRFSEEVASQLQPALASRLDPSRAAAALDPNLPNEAAGEIDLTEYLTGRQRELWEFVSGLETGSQVLLIPDRLGREPRAAVLATRSEGEHIRLLEERHHLLEATARLSARENELAERSSVLAEERDVAIKRATVVAAEAEEARREIARIHKDLTDVRDSFSWRLTRPLRALKARVG
jgi:hypothetical protein